MYDACLRIAAARRENHTARAPGHQADPDREILLNHGFTIDGNDFTNAGMVSTQVKSILKKIGLDSKLIRRVAICTYEGEMNVVMHARKAKVGLQVTPRRIDCCH